MININTSTDEQSTVDSLGGGDYLLESKIYGATIDLAYYSESLNGAGMMNFVFSVEGGKKHKETFYITGTTANGNNTFTIKNGKQIDLAGYTKAFNIIAIAMNMDLVKAIQDAPAKTIPVWDWNVRAEVDKEFDHVLVDAVGKTLKLAIVKKCENKSVKNNATGKYDKVNEKHEKNEIRNSMFPDSSMTVNEAKAGAKEAKFAEEWAAKWNGKVDNWYKPVADTPVADDAVGQDSGNSLFA